MEGTVELKKHGEAAGVTLLASHLTLAAALISIAGGIAGGVIGAYAMRDEAVRESRLYTDRSAEAQRRELVSKAELATSREIDRDRFEVKVDALTSKIDRITIAVERLAARR